MSVKFFKLALKEEDIVFRTIGKVPEYGVQIARYVIHLVKE